MSVFGGSKDTEENKLVYTELFEKYSGLIEGVLEEKLGKALPGSSPAPLSLSPQSRAFQGHLPEGPPQFLGRLPPQKCLHELRGCAIALLHLQ